MLSVVCGQDAMEDGELLYVMGQNAEDQTFLWRGTYKSVGGIQKPESIHGKKRYGKDPEKPLIGFVGDPFTFPEQPKYGQNRQQPP